MDKLFILKKAFLILSLFLLFGCNLVEQNNSKKKINLALFGLALVSTCKLPTSVWVRNLKDSKSSYCLPVTLIASSSEANLYVQNGLNTNLDYSSVLNVFKTKIYPIEIETFGLPSDVDGNGKIEIIILDVQDNFATTGNFFGGFIDSINFQQDTQSPLRSNQAEILYIDGVELLKLRDKDFKEGKPDAFYATIAHEFQHLIRLNYSKVFDERWIDEGTSELASDLTGFGPQTSRTSCYRGDSNCKNAVVGESLLNWTNSVENYAYAYSFMKYLYSNSGANETQRKNFFLTLSKGQNSIRANNAKNFFQLFTSSTNFDSNVLTTDPVSIAERLLTVFVASSVKYNTSSVYKINGVVQNFSSVQTKYPLPTELEELYKPNPIVSKPWPNSFNFSPSEFGKYVGNPNTVSGSSEFVMVKGNNDFVILNTNILNGKASTQGTANSNLEHKNFNLQRICPYEEIIENEKNSTRPKNYLIP